MSLIVAYFHRGNSECCEPSRWNHTSNNLQPLWETKSDETNRIREKSTFWSNQSS